MKKTFYTAQSDIVLKKLKSQNCVYVKKKYIEKKYGKNLSKNIFIAYDWFVNEFKKRVDKPNLAEYPFWLFKDKNYAKTYGSSNLLKVNIDDNKIVLFDNHKWERVLSLNYVGDSLEEEKEFDKRLKKYGLQTGLDVFNSPLHIKLQKEIKESFKKIFDIDEKSNIRAASWCLKNDRINKLK